MEVQAAAALYGTRSRPGCSRARAVLGLHDLAPLQDLEPTVDGAPSAWRVVGPRPLLRLSRAFAPGWIRIRLTMKATAPGWMALSAVDADGRAADAPLMRGEVQGEAGVDCHVHLRRPATALILSPPDGPGEFRLERLNVERLSTIRALGHAATAKWRLLRKYWHTGAALRRGFGLLLRGQFRLLWSKLFRGINGPDLEGREPSEQNKAYEAWRARRALSDVDRERLRREAAALDDPPVFSVLLIAPDAGGLQRSAASVLRQIYLQWELFIVCIDGATPPKDGLDDSRIRIVYAPKADALSAALAAATGDYALVLTAGDELAEHALSRLAATVAADRALDMIYADEDRLLADGRHVEPYFKPDWSPDLFLSWMYTGRGVYRTDRVRQVGGFRAECGAAQEYDLALHMRVGAAHIYHIPDILLHRATWDEPGEAEAAQAVLRRHLKRTGRDAVVEPGPAPQMHRVRFAVRDSPRVSIVVPSACRLVRIRGERTFYLHKCLESIARSTWPNREVVILHGPDVPAALDPLLHQAGAVRAAYAAPFSWARAMNQGAALARGEHLLFLNDDVEVITPDWLERLLEFSQQPQIGAVGAKLLFPGGQLQHAGVAVLAGRPVHPFYGHRGDHAGYFDNLRVPRNCSAVTGACLMTRADVFRSMGGFDESFPLNYNDVDYCLRLIAAGRRVVCTPYARLWHHELGTRPAGVHPAEMEAFHRRWGAAWAEDPFHNPNLSVDHLDCRIRTTEKLRSAG